MAKTRVSDLAAKFRIRPQDLTQWLAAKGIDVPSRGTGLDDRQVARVYAEWWREQRRYRGAGGKRPAEQTQRWKDTGKRESVPHGREPPESHSTIPNPNTLAALIDREIRTQYHDSTNLAWTHVEQAVNDYCHRKGAVRFARLSRPMLHRFRKGERRSIGEAAVYWLLFLIPDVEAVLDAVSSPGARALLGRANSFYDHRELARSAERKVARERVIQAMEASYREALERFRKSVRAKGHAEETLTLALDRVVAPFVLVPEIGYVDREWDELTTTEQHDYVRHALARETILLTRPPDLERAILKGENPFLAALREPDAQTRRRLLRRRR